MINLWLILESIGIIWKWDHLFEDKQCPMMFLSLLNPVIHRVFIHYSHFKFCFHCLKSNVWIEHPFPGTLEYIFLNLIELRRTCSWKAQLERSDSWKVFILGIKWDISDRNMSISTGLGCFQLDFLEFGILNGLMLFPIEFGYFQLKW